MPREQLTAFGPARPTRTFDVVVEQLRERIVSGALRPGDRLPSEREMAEQFAVSRNMVREAVRMLESTGILELRKGATGGAFVARGRSDYVARSLSDMISVGGMQLSDLLEARLALSSVIIRLAVRRAADADLALLDENVQEAARLARAEDWHAVAVVNVEFHRLLARASGNQVLEMLQNSIMDAMSDVSHVAGPVRSDMTVRSRRVFLRRLHAGDAEGAVREMEANLRRVHNYFLAHSEGTKYAPTPAAKANGVAGAETTL